MLPYGARYASQLLLIAALSFAIVIFLNRDVLPGFDFLGNAQLQTFKTLFLSLVLEAVPFILLGVVVSSLLQVFVSERMLQRIVPKHPLPAVAFAALLGIALPFCECGMIPIVRRLILKGVPAYVGVVFILAGPIVNPVVFAATYMAFRTRPEMAYSRMLLAFAVACAVGLVLYKALRGNPLKHSAATLSAAGGGADQVQPATAGGKLAAVLEHASGEFFDMGKFLIYGALVTAAIQTIVPRGSLVAIGTGEWSSHLFMMGFAYVLSLCSTSDAFVASSFLTTFSTGSLLTFLVFGPMLDLKSTFMLLSAFKVRFVLLLAVCVAAFVLVGSIIFEQIGLP